MQGSEPPVEAETRANELYWTSDLSVNQIADRLDMSKGMLYGLIEPLEAELGCPSCTGELVWPNRTARAKGFLSCPSCGWEGTPDEAEPVGSDDAGGRSGVERAVESPASDRSGALAGTWEPARVRTVAGGALLGAAAGLALVLWARRR